MGRLRAERRHQLGDFRTAATGLRCMFHREFHPKHFLKKVLRGSGNARSPLGRCARIVSVGITLELLTSTRKLMRSIRNFDGAAGVRCGRRDGGGLGNGRALAGVLVLRKGGGREGLVRGEHDAAGNRAFSEFSQHFIGLR